MQTTETIQETHFLTKQDLLSKIIKFISEISYVKEKQDKPCACVYLINLLLLYFYLIFTNSSLNLTVEVGVKYTQSRHKIIASKRRIRLPSFQ